MKKKPDNIPVVPLFTHFDHAVTARSAARGVVKSAINDYPNADISVMIVWIPMLSSDNEAAAREASGMLDDARVLQFWDANRRSGISYSSDVFPRWA